MSDPTQETSAPLEQAVADCEHAWARFLAAVDRAPAERLDEPGVCGDWSLTLLVGHVGYWDAVEAEYFALADRPELDWQPLNEENAAANAGRAYAELRAEAEANHRTMVEMIRANPRLDPAKVRELTHDHYVEHAGQIEAWLADGAGESSYNPPRPVSELLPLLDKAWGELQAVLARVPAERMTEPGVCEEWSVKDLMGHVAIWDGQVIDDIDGYAAGRPPLRIPTDEWNASEARKRSSLSVAELTAELDATHARMRRRLAEVAEIDAEMVAVDTWDHYREHIGQIERWLAAGDA